MATDLIVNGVTYRYPSVGDSKWGDQATRWAVAVTGSTLQKTGGDFTLTSEVDFGANAGIKTLSIKSQALDQLNTGFLSLGESEQIVWNSGGSPNALTVTGNVLLFNGNALQASNSITANIVQFTPTGTISSTDVQTAIAEIDSTPITINVGAGLSGGGAVTLDGNVTITNTGVLGLTVSGVGLTTNQTTGSVIVTSNATSANTPSTIVARDPSGNFQANVITATATSARYADLAEKYTADAYYEPGTVVCFGGDKEVTLNKETGSTTVAGVITTNPAYVMNSDLDSEYVACIALQGRVPVKVLGSVRKGDLMIGTINGHATAKLYPDVGTVIGKALEDFDGLYGVIEIAVGRV